MTPRIPPHPTPAHLVHPPQPQPATPMPTQPSRHHPVRALLTFLLGLTTAMADPTSPTNSGHREPALRLTESFERVAKAVRQLPDQTPFGYDAGVSILSTVLTPGAEARVTHSLRAGRRYLLIGGADALTSDMDIAILDVQGRPLAEDRLVDATPRTSFTARTTGPHIIKISAFGPHPACCTLVVLADDGIRLPANRLDEALAGVLSAGQSAGQSSPARIAFRPEPAGWILWGGVCGPEQSLGIPQIPLGVGLRTFVGAGDSQCQEIEFLIFNNRAAIVARATPDNATPVVSTKAQGPLEARLQLRSVRSNGPSLVLAALLDQRPGRLD